MKHDHSTQYKAGSLSLIGAVSMGTAVIIGAGIFALTGQIAELGGQWFPLAFLVAAIVTAFSAYSYVKMSNAYPSAGGIAMFLQKAYGKASQTATCKDMLERTDHKLAEAKENIKQLKNIHDALEKLSESCPGGDMPLSECPILDHLYPQNATKTKG